MAETERVKYAVEVQAGLIPDQPDPVFTKRWFVTSKEWAEAESQLNLLVETNGRALGYAAMLMSTPERLNWVRTDWVWF